jgi:hypothetical protein
MRDFDAAGLDRAALRGSSRRLPAPFVAAADRRAPGRPARRRPRPARAAGFRGPADFAANGLGFGAVLDGRLACAATSYTMSSRRAEVAIATRPEFRGAASPPPRRRR